MKIKKTPLTQIQKKQLESLIKRKIYIRNSFDINQKEIQALSIQSLENAKIYLERNRLGHQLRMFDENKLYKTILDIENFLQLKQAPRRMECYDISHLSGKFVYGSMVTFIDGVPNKKLYRLFKCKERNDDFANHAEVMNRRLKKGLELENGEIEDTAWKLPDLLVIDGGKGQLSATFEILKFYNLQDKIDIVGLAKKEEEVFLSDMTRFENKPKSNSKSYKIGKEGGVLLEGDMKFLIQRIRDEAHRFAIKNNRNARIKNLKKSELDGIERVGEKTKQKILENFGSIENLIKNLYDNPQIVYEILGKTITNKLKDKYLI